MRRVGASSSSGKGEYEGRGPEGGGQSISGISGSVGADARAGGGGSISWLRRGGRIVMHGVWGEVPMGVTQKQKREREHSAVDA